METFNKIVANFVINEILRAVKELKIDISELPVKTEKISILLRMLERKVISESTAKIVFRKMLKCDKEPELIISELNLWQNSDKSKLLNIITDVIFNNKQEVDDYYSGKIKLFDFFMGEIMKKSSGRANPKVAREILQKVLDKEV